jgi:hypothetical protein
MPNNGIVLFNLVPKAARITCRIGADNVLLDGAGEDPILPGLSTGLVPWLPVKDSLRAEGQGYSVAELRPFLKAGESPVVLLMEKSAGTLSFSIIPNATDRASGFYDAINLTPEPTLQVTVDGKPVSLPKSKRTRVGSNKTLNYKLPDGASGELDSGEDPPHALMIFYRSASGKTRCAVVPDILVK